MHTDARGNQVAKLCDLGLAVDHVNQSPEQHIHALPAALTLLVGTEGYRPPVPIPFAVHAHYSS